MQIEKIQTKVGGVWKEADLSHVKVGGVWKNATVYVKVAGRWITQSLTPKVGDFVYSDKTWSSSYNSAKTCVGIVFYVDLTDPARPYRIVSLTDSVRPQTGNYQDAGTGISQYVAMWGPAETLNYMPSYLTEDSALKDKNGFLNATALAANSKVLITPPIWNDPKQYPAFNFCFSVKSQEMPPPLNGWWLPSCGEMAEIGEQISLINKNIQVAGGSSVKGIYSTSSQFDIAEIWSYAIVTNGDTGIQTWPKEEALGARAVTGFSI